MTSTSCVTCQKSKAPLHCGLCGASVCKGCVHFVEDRFTFLESVPPELSHGAYCDGCFTEKVQNALAEYEATMEAARNVSIYFKNQSKETRLFKRSKEVFRVQDCPDRDETILRLAFRAASRGYNGLIDVDVTSEKVRHGGYQTLKWSGTAVPLRLDERSR